MSNIGLPKIEVNFKGLATSIIERSQKGVVCLILKDDTDKTFDFIEYDNIDKIETEKFTESNVNYIKDCFLGNPSKILVARIDLAGMVSDMLTKVKSKYFDWIGIAEGTEQEQQDLATWIINNDGDYGCIVFNATTTDNMKVVNFKNTSVTPVGKTSITGEKYISRLLGLFAGLPFTQTATYYILQDLESVEDVIDLEATINAGGLALFNDEGNVRVARAVNSLVTIALPLTDDMKKITIVEAMNLIRRDIKSTFKNSYVGKSKNKYDNQILFISAVNSYFRALQGEDILDSEYDNVASVDVEAQRNAWLGIGKMEAESWNDITVKTNTFRSNIFLAGNVKILDGIEDLAFNISM